MPPCPIIDTHLHLWDPAELRISWLDGNETLARRYMPAEFVAHSTGIAVEAAVYVEVAVEPQYSYLEAVAIDRLAAQFPTIQGIVAAAPVEYGAQARAYYAALRQIGPRVKGVRRLLQGESDARYAARPEVVAGVRALADYELSFDICIYHHQLPAVIELVQQAPEVSFILDHIAKPAISAGELEPWKTHLRALAALPNVACKISGLTTEADHAHWTSAQLRPYAAHVIQVFGPDRIMFGGDWPVSLQSTTYWGWVETVDRLVGELSQGDQLKFWRDNARRIYRLA